MRYLLCLLIVGLSTTLWAQEANSCQMQHEKSLATAGVAHLATLPFLRFEQESDIFSVVASEREASLLTIHGDKVYHIYTVRDTAQENRETLTFTIHIAGGEMDSTLVGTIEKSELQCTIKIDPEKTTPGFVVDTVLPAALSCVDHLYCQDDWWKGFLTFSPQQYESRSYYATREQAVAHVPTHVSPKSCFVWRDGSASLPWRPIPGTGCAHWVAHQRGITTSPGCYDRYAIRVSQVTSGKQRYALSNAHSGDIWTDTAGGHCGIVLSVGNNRVYVRHCSSGQGGVVESWFSSGYAWR